MGRGGGGMSVWSVILKMGQFNTGRTSVLPDIYDLQLVHLVLLKICSILE